MIKRSILTAVIGFLFGVLLYYKFGSSSIVILIMGCAGYCIGLILDNADVKHQLETYHFSSIPATQEIFQPDEISEALILYSPKENVTTVSIDFLVDTKPQDFRLSVLKNLHDHEFRIIEESNKTIFSLTLSYPDCCYPKLLATQKEEFHFDIRERGLDFKTAIEKIVPGLVLSYTHYPDLYREEKFLHYSDVSSDYSKTTSSPPPFIDTQRSPNNISERRSNIQNKYPSSTTSKSFDQKTVFRELIEYPPNPELQLPENGGKEFQNIGNAQEINKPNYENKEMIIDESEIMEDLLDDSQQIDSQLNVKIPDLSPEEVQKLKGLNDRQLKDFLNKDNDSLPSSSPFLVTADKLDGIHVKKKPTDDDYSSYNDRESTKEIKTVSLPQTNDSIRLDYSKISQVTNDKDELGDFDINIIDELEKRTNEAIEKAKDKLELNKEMNEAKKYFEEENATEESTS